MYCPIMSYKKQNYDKIYCIEETCAFWNEEMKMCCIKSAMIAAAAKPAGGSSPTAQAYYIPPSSYCQTNAVSDKIINDSYQINS